MTSGRHAGDLGDPPEREAEVVRRALARLAQDLPPGWTLEFKQDPLIADRRADALVELTGPDRASAVLVVEAKRSVATRDLSSMLEQARSGIRSHAGATVPLLVARHFSSSARTWLEERDVSYADATGNLRVVLERPALFLRDAGEDRDPWRGPGRPRGTLSGAPAARVVRALADFAPPVTVPELVRRSGASTGAAYRVVEFLEREALIERTVRGPITQVRWRSLIERWSEDYGFQRSNVVSAYLHPRGIPSILDELTASPMLRYVITGSLAAHEFAPYAPPRLAMLYVDDPGQVAERLGLRVVDSGANTLLATGDYGVVFDRAVEIGGLRFVAPGQAAVDLLTGPGRSPAEAGYLLDWMEDHERDWRW